LDKGTYRERNRMLISTVNVRSAREMMKTMIDLGLNDDDTIVSEEDTTTTVTGMAKDDTDEGPMRKRMITTVIETGTERGGGGTVRLTRNEKREGEGGERGRGKIDIVEVRESLGGLILEKGRGVRGQVVRTGN
jgi:hypothetical protein